MNKQIKAIYNEVLETQTCCYFSNCDCKGQLEIHHVYRGKNRDNSTKYKMLVRLCDYHHDNMTEEQDLELKQVFQEKFIKENPNKDFLKIFYRNYL
jgi:uncharacterized protein YeeX (DUF496 family)